MNCCSGRSRMETRYTNILNLTMVAVQSTNALKAAHVRTVPSGALGFAKRTNSSNQSSSRIHFLIEDSGYRFDNFLTREGCQVSTTFQSRLCLAT
ncbi:hypothetical protein Y032_0489g2375 [Ancylostoma ceylanicum]|uniref:Uncharacterized protein n=1 Tax=Ancylostoma ceylanicum TaxID=53326 RepID=A0A016WVI6_9BILA|nr:hypothetical protein Y032_0489g2375 [Ancylostoma ceylanicum]